jgi:hypothetical protein
MEVDGKEATAERIVTIVGQGCVADRSVYAPNGDCFQLKADLLDLTGGSKQILT